MIFLGFVRVNMDLKKVKILILELESNFNVTIVLFVADFNLNNEISIFELECAGSFYRH